MKHFLIILFLIISLNIQAQRNWDEVTVTTHQLTHNISFLVGAGGNVGVLTGEDGVIIIDDQYAEINAKIKEAIKNLSGNDLKFVLNTHYHFDHTGGNALMSQEGATIIAHQNVRERLGKTFDNSILNRTMEATSENYWPAITFKESISFYFNNEQVDFIALPKAHTDGDAFIHFKTSNIIHTGDTFVRYGYPFIDIDAGGTIDGMIAAQEKILALVDEDTKIIPGHGGLSTKKDVEDFLAMLKSTRNIVAKLKSKGLSLDECLSTNPLKPYNDQWNGTFINAETFIRIIYETIP